jgi:hypothetical protein
MVQCMSTSLSRVTKFLGRYVYGFFFPLNPNRLLRKRSAKTELIKIFYFKRKNILSCLSDLGLCCKIVETMIYMFCNVSEQCVCLRDNCRYH